MRVKLRTVNQVLPEKGSWEQYAYVNKGSRDDNTGAKLLEDYKDSVELLRQSTLQDDGSHDADGARHENHKQEADTERDVVIALLEVALCFVVFFRTTHAVPAAVDISTYRQDLDVRFVVGLTRLRRGSGSVVGRRPPCRRDHDRGRHGQALQQRPCFESRHLRRRERCSTSWSHGCGSRRREQACRSGWQEEAS